MRWIFDDVSSFLRGHPTVAILSVVIAINGLFNVLKETRFKFEQIKCVDI